MTDPIAIELDDVDPEQAVAALRHLPGLAFLDSNRPDADHGRFSYLVADPFLTVRTRGRQVVVADAAESHRIAGDPFAMLEGLMRRYRQETAPGLPPFQGGAIGYFGYDLFRQIERVPDATLDDLCLPELAVGLYDWTIAWDHGDRRCWLISTGLPSRERSAAFARCERVRDLLKQRPTDVPSSPLAAVGQLRSNFRRADYLAAVRAAKKYISEGEIYQVNLSQRFAGDWPVGADPWPLYLRLRAVSPVPYGAYLELGEMTVLSASPECFLRLNGQIVDTHPIKGTRPRGATPAEDARLRRDLESSTKDRAENVMIVDLLRNDLGKVCRVGSVAVPRLADVEGFSHVWQLVSTVVGEVLPDRSAIDVLRACFPGGSVTGCPKIRALQIIEELEPVRRGVYCGAIGYVGFDNTMNTSIVIRTLILTGGRLFLQVGGAIVTDSDPAGEYEETLVKAAAALAALGANADEAQ